MPKGKNIYTKLPGYKWARWDHPNGWFGVFDGWQLGSDNDARWIVRKMPDGPQKCVPTYKEARRLALESAETMVKRLKWWLSSQ